MKKFVKMMRLSLFMMMGLIVSAAPVAAAGDNPRTIHVSGTAQRQVAPDNAYITVGVVTQSEKVETARAENAKIVKQIVKNLAGFNIAEADIRTSSFQLNPVYSEINNNIGIATAPQERRIIAYSVENYLTIKVKDITTIGNIIDKSFDSGANRFSGIDFNVSNAKAIQDELLKEAVADGYKKAKLVASASGSSIGNIMNIVVGGISNFAGARAKFNSDAVMVSAEYDSSQVFAGSLTLSASVELTYELN